MPKKNVVEALRNLFEKELKKAGIPIRGKVFTMGEKNYLGDYVLGDIVVDIVGSPSDRRLETIENFKRQYGHRYTVAILAPESMKGILGCSVADEVYTSGSIKLLVNKIKKHIESR
jgi:hypothetical protein